MLPYPLKVEDGGYNNIQGIVKETAPYIADVDSPREFPWRVLVLGTDKDIASTNVSYLLASRVILLTYRGLNPER